MLLSLVWDITPEVMVPTTKSSFLVSVWIVLVVLVVDNDVKNSKIIDLFVFR